MAYRTEQIRGYYLDNISFMQEEGGLDLYEKVKSEVLSGLKNENIPFSYKEDSLKSGGMFGSKSPLLIISNPAPENKYFDLGICVNSKSLIFPLLGESKENTKANKKEFLKNNGNHIQAALIKVDELKLQQERVWQQQVIDCINSLISD